MTQRIKKGFLYILSVSVMLLSIPTTTLAANRDFSVSFTETAVNQSDNIYKLTVCVKGYNNTSALDFALVYDNSRITPIDINEYNRSGSVLKLDGITYSALLPLEIKSADSEVFSLQLGAETTLTDGQKALSISAYTTDEYGYDLSATADILEIYYLATSGEDYFSIANTDDVLFDIYGSINGAGITIIAKTGETTCYMPHSSSTHYADSDAMLAPSFAYANKDTVSDKCGETLTWALTEDGVLTISGEGEMYHFITDPAPWSEHTDKITKVVVKDGATSIGTNAFAACAKLKEIEIPNTVSVIGDNAFSGCEALETVTYAGNEKQWNEISIGIGNDALASKLVFNTIRMGDVTGDGVVDVGDAVKLLKAIASKTTDEFSKDVFTAADVTRDGVIDVGDAVKLLKAIASKTTDDL